MTDKQEKILQAALRLFASQGYASTSTSKIARDAGVSEGLIFRHFGNKEGLLDAVVELGLSDVEAMGKRIVQSGDPETVITRAIEASLQMLREQREFWQLLYSLKFQHPDIVRRFSESRPMAEIMQTLEWSFASLGYKSPKAETQLLYIIINGLFTALQDEDEIIQDAFVNFIKSKYGV